MQRQGAPETAEEQLRAVTEAMQDAVVAIGPDHNVVLWSGAAERMFGWTREEAVGRPVTAIMPDRFRADHTAGVQRVLAGGPPHLVGRTSVEVVAVHRDGTEFPVELSLGEFHDGDRRHFTAVMRDVREREWRRRVERAQQAVSRALLQPGSEHETARKLLAGLGEELGWSVACLWLTAADGARLRFAAGWAREGTAAERLLEASRAMEFAPGQGLPGQAAAEGLVQIEDVRADVRFLRSGPAREAGVRTAVAFPMRAGEETLGAVEFFLGEGEEEDRDLATDTAALAAPLALLFQRRRAELELARSNEDLDRFATLVSHDLSEPLRTVAGFSSLLASRHGDALGPEGRELLDYVSGGAERMREMLDGLLAYSRASRDPLARERVELDEVVSAVRDSLSAALAETGGRVKADALPAVQGDAGRLGQVIQNLVANALKFRSAEPPLVRVSAEPDGEGWWVVEVRDNGIGIAPAHRERIFGMHQRLHAREAYAGIGVGLALVRRIVERHGGRVWVEDNDPHGTAFRFTLPAA